MPNFTRTTRVALLSFLLSTATAMAADTVIVEADHLVGLGDIEPENVVTPGVLVDFIVEGSVRS